jgi:hypothetical protein
MKKTITLFFTVICLSSSLSARDIDKSSKEYKLMQFLYQEIVSLEKRVKTLEENKINEKNIIKQETNKLDIEVTDFIKDFNKKYGK